MGFPHPDQCGIQLLVPGLGCCEWSQFRKFVAAVVRVAAIGSGTAVVSLVEMLGPFVAAPVVVVAAASRDAAAVVVDAIAGSNAETTGR